MSDQSSIETQILPQQVPSHARAFLEDCKRLFENEGFKFFGFTSRPLGSGETQYALVCIGDSAKIIAHGLCLKKKPKGLFSFLTADIRKTRMLQSFFSNGFRLITSDMLVDTERPQVQGVRWISLSTNCTVDEMLEQHRRNIDDVIQKEHCETIKIGNLSDYVDFPKKYKY